MLRRRRGKTRARARARARATATATATATARGTRLPPPGSVSFGHLLLVRSVNGSKIRRREMPNGVSLLPLTPPPQYCPSLPGCATAIFFIHPAPSGLFTRDGCSSRRRRVSPTIMSSAMLGVSMRRGLRPLVRNMQSRSVSSETKLRFLWAQVYCTQRNTMQTPSPLR